MTRSTQIVGDSSALRHLSLLALTVLIASGCNEGKRGSVSRDQIDNEVRAALLPDIETLENLYYDVDHTTEIYSYELPAGVSSVKALATLRSRLVGWEIVEAGDSTLLAKKPFRQFSVIWWLQIVALPKQQRIVFGYREGSIREGQQEREDLDKLIQGQLKGDHNG